MAIAVGVRIVRGALPFVSMVGLVGLDAVLYWRYLRDLEAAPRDPLPDLCGMCLIGLCCVWAGRISHETVHSPTFDMRKRPGVVRIGCLGDSFTYGSEVSSSEDYPNVLQRLFRERGYSQERSHFGSGWYGFSRRSSYGKKSLAVSISIMRCWGPRLSSPGDTTFDHGSPSNIYYLHARNISTEWAQARRGLG